MHTTLVDCLCTTKVHKDGSGVEIYYCPVHKAAPELLEVLEALTARCCLNDRFPELTGPAFKAIRKAKGE